ncbi:MAG: protein kinase [Anaerolineales bacterium]|nr:protein kinase [Anaerolineales bacterium]
MNLPATVFGKYEIKGTIREKALFSIVGGIDLESGQEIHAIIFDADLVPVDQFIRRFELVAKNLRNLDPQRGVPVLDVGEYENQAVVVHPQIEGQTLSEILDKNGTLSIDQVLGVLQCVGDYLDKLHRAGLPHGMLTPEHVLLALEDEVRIMGAGYALGVNLPELISSGQIEPKPYHAPELRGGAKLTPETDFYALGATIYEALTGEPPELDPKYPFPGNKHPGLPPELDDLVAKCLAVDLSQRVRSAAELLNRLEDIRRGIAMGTQDTILGMEDALVGHTLGAYQLVERLGQGGMATVYKAYEPVLDRYVAIKILPQFFARDPSFSHRFRREARAVAQLDHPNIVPIFSFGEEGEITYIAMRYVEGGTLKKIRGQVYAPEQAIRLLLPIAQALSYAHKRGVIHRDIKPSNIFMADGEWPLLGDFGLAKMAEVSQKLTGTGVGMGTPMYMSPEQGQGDNVDHRTDIYSMGIMLYEMLTGDVPFRADTPMAIVIKHITAPMPIPREINPDIPEDLERIILKATAKSPDNRFQSVEEMCAVLEVMLSRLIAVAPAAPMIFEDLEDHTPTEVASQEQPEVQPDPSPVNEDEILEAPTKLVSGVSICPACNNRNRPGMRFCEECGESLIPLEPEQAASSETKCSECNTNNRPGMKFCEECGNPLE